MVLDNFIYNAEHRVVVCRRCATCLVPREQSWLKHLRAKPHELKGRYLQLTVEHLATYSLRSFDELRAQAKDTSRQSHPCQPIAGLALYDGFICHCAPGECTYKTRRIKLMRDHLAVHGKKGKQHSDTTPLWRACQLQTYFTAKGMIDYFEVEDVAPTMSPQTAPLNSPSSSFSDDTTPTISQQAAPLGTSSSSLSPSASTIAVQQQVRSHFHRVIKERICHRSQLSCAVRIPLRSKTHPDCDPWLVITGFSTHLDGLYDAEIQSSYALHARSDENVVSNGSSENFSDSELRRILIAAEHTLRDAYRLCSDSSPHRKMTQLHALTLNHFRLGDARDIGATRGALFRASKHSNSLVACFRLTKQLLAYYYRVVYRSDGHFTNNTEGHALPHDVIKPTLEQSQAMDAIITVLRRQDALQDATSSASGADMDINDIAAATAELDDQLKKAIRDLLVSLICCWIVSKPFQSPLLSFCAMRSRTLLQHDDDALYARGRCKWREPGNCSRDLSALIWMFQLMLFDAVCSTCGDDESQILPRLELKCRTYCHTMAQSPFGQMLQWRSCLFAASMNTITEHQARWSIDGFTVDYKGTKLHMNHIAQLVVNEYKVASRILYDDLLLGIMADTPRIEPWQIEDDLDQDEQDASWLTDARNAELLADTQLAIWNKIEASPDLERTFVRQLDPGSPEVGFCPRAIALYEKRIQDFLERLLVMIYLSSGQPLRSTELLSVIVSNTDVQRRSVLVWEKSVLFRVRYHNSLELTGAAKDNLRFLPSEIGSLFLTFLAFVQPLREVFLRQNQPEARLSPYLWSKMDGSVWEGGSVSACLSRACARAAVPTFNVSWWRQVAASITKEKFNQQQRAHFDLDDVDACEEIQDEEDLAYLAGVSNYSSRTSNYAYAGSTNLNASSLLHRAYHASDCWRTLFNIDAKLLAERLGPGSCAAAQRVAPKERTADLSLTACLSYAHAKLACEHLLEKLDEHLKASGSSYLDSVVVRIGQLSGSECMGEWTTAEHMAMIAQSSNTIRALPKLTGEASWIRVDRAAKAMVELANVSHGSRESSNATSTPSRTFDILHLENGARRSWADILKIFARSMDLSSTDTLEWEAWLASVQKLGNQIDDSVPQTPVDANPCIKILDFLQQDFLRLGTGGVVLDLAKARSYSRTLRNSQAISDELIQLSRWLERTGLASISDAPD